MIKKDLLQILAGIRVSIISERPYRDGIDTMEAKCPFAPFLHAGGKDKRPSFAVFANSKGYSGYICSSCGSQGRISDLVYKLAKLRKENYNTLIAQADDAEMQIPLPEWEDAFKSNINVAPQAIDKKMHDSLYEDIAEHKEALDYLTGRGISLETAYKLGLLYDPDEKRILFPVQDRDGSLFGYSGRQIIATTEDNNIKIKDYFGLPKKHFILGEHLWKQGLPVLIVEGLFAYAHLHEIGAGEYANIGALLGASLSEEKAARIRYQNAPTYLLLDNDDGGDIGLFGKPSSPNKEKGAVRKLIEHVPVHVPAWVDDKTDPDQLSLEEVLFMLKKTPVFMKSDFPY